MCAVIFAFQNIHIKEGRFRRWRAESKFGAESCRPVFVLRCAPNEDWRPGRYTFRTNHPPKTAWERTPYYTRTYSAGCLFIRGEKPQELARIAKITARQWEHYQSVNHRNNPVLQGLQWLRLFENESVNTYAQAAEIAGVCRGRVWQLVSLVTRLPREVTDFLVANKDPFIRAHFSERRLMPLTLLESDDQKVTQFEKMLTEAPKMG